MKDIGRQKLAPIARRESLFPPRSHPRSPLLLWSPSRDGLAYRPRVSRPECIGTRAAPSRQDLAVVTHFVLPTVLHDYGVDENQVAFVYTSCEGRENLTEDNVLRLLLKSAVAQAAMPNDINDLLGSPAQLTFDIFENALLGWTTSTKQLVFLFDEFESLAVNPNLGPQFFSGLRRVASEQRVSYVTATKLSLIALTGVSESVLSSPFFNFLHTLRLGLFTRDESRLNDSGFIKEGRAGVF